MCHIAPSAHGAEVPRAQALPGATLEAASAAGSGAVRALWGVGGCEGFVGLCGVCGAVWGRGLHPGLALSILVLWD